MKLLCSYCRLLKRKIKPKQTWTETQKTDVRMNRSVDRDRTFPQHAPSIFVGFGFKIKFPFPSYPLPIPLGVVIRARRRGARRRWRWRFSRSSSRSSTSVFSDIIPFRTISSFSIPLSTIVTRSSLASRSRTFWSIVFISLKKWFTHNTIDSIELMSFSFWFTQFG